MGKNLYAKWQEGTTETTREGSVNPLPGKLPFLFYFIYIYFSVCYQGQEVLFNIRAPAELVNPDTGHFMELDVWVPSLNLAFEYQVQPTLV